LQGLPSLPPLLDVVFDEFFGIFLKDIVDFVDQLIHFLLEFFAALNGFGIGLRFLLRLRTAAFGLGFFFLLIRGPSRYFSTPRGRLL
jgi:hypothetical protein